MALFYAHALRVSVDLTIDGLGVHLAGPCLAASISLAVALVSERIVNSQGS